MKQTADLQTAISFVTTRIVEAALRSGEPLTDEQRDLLDNLPGCSSTSTAGNYFDPELGTELAIRDFAYERLCAAAKAAHLHDLRVNPAAGVDWEFAAAVSKLNRHPISRLLQWAGVKERRPRWDSCVLICFALVLIFLTVALFLLIGDEPWSALQWAGLGAGCAVITAVMWFALQRIEKSQLRRTIEKCRRLSSFSGEIEH